MPVGFRPTVVLMLAAAASVAVALFVLGGSWPSSRHHDVPAPPTFRLAAGAESAELLKAVLDYSAEGFAYSPGPLSESTPSSLPPILLSRSFALGQSAAGNVYPAASCRNDRPGERISGIGDSAAVAINGTDIEHFSRTLARALVQANDQPVQMDDPGFDRLTLLSASDVEAFFHSHPADWAGFAKQHRGARGYLQVSRAVIGRRRVDSRVVEEALVFVYVASTPDCGAYRLYGFSRSPGAWRVSMALTL